MVHFAQSGPKALGLRMGLARTLRMRTDNLTQECWPC